jgi:hypothetical protein
MRRGDYSFSKYSFELDFGKWLETCLNASRYVLGVIALFFGSRFKLRIIDSVPPGAKKHALPEIFTIEGYHKVNLNAF